jgi:peptide/nickel transport system substrate-binding protein
MGSSPGWWRALSAGVVLALAAAGCADDGTSSEGPDGGAGAESTTTGTPKVGGSVTMGVYSETFGLDPVVTNGGGTTGNTGLSAIFDTIVRYDNATKKYEMRTAESLTPSADFSEWTLKLKPGIKFSDGTDYDADAVVFGLKRHTLLSSRGSGLVGNIKEYTVVDKLTVKFTLVGPWSNFPYLLAFTPGMIPSPTAVKAACGANQEIKPRECAFNTKPVGAGPFVVDSYKPKDSITLKRNPSYWGGQVYLDELRFVVIAGAAPTYEAMKADTLQVAFLREADVVKRVQSEAPDQNYLNLQWLGGVTVMNNGKVNCKGGVPPAVCQGKPDGVVDIATPTADRRIRQAVAYAFNLPELDRRINNGTGFPGSEFFQEGSRWQSPGPIVEYNPEKAKQLVEEVKKEGKWDGTIRVNCHNAPSRREWAVAAQTFLTAVGFKVVVKNDYDVAALVNDVLNNKAFDLACYGMTTAEEAPEVSVQQVFLSSSPGNVMNFSVPAIDALVPKVRGAATDAEKKAALDQIQEIWKTEMPSLVYEAVPEMIAWRTNVHGLQFNVSTTALFHQAWLG